MFIADDLGSWLIGALADAGRKKLTSLVLGTDLERALRSAVAAAVQRTAEQLWPHDKEQAEHVARVISEVFREPVQFAPLTHGGTVLEALQAGIAGQLAVVNDADLTGTWQFSSDVLGIPAGILAEELTGHLLGEIVARGAGGGPLEPLANQLNHDVTHLQGQRLESRINRLVMGVEHARHQEASPALAPSLAGAVDDPRRRETLMLYAATAYADQIVRACLDSATIPALALAFDCAETAGSGLALELRLRLARVREQAYEDDCDPRHRRLMAAVQAVRLARQTVTTSAGTLICDRPVTADLYWLFLQDTRSPQPDSPCELGLGRPAAGIWGSEALAFVKWLNTITAGSMQAGFRLPYESELGEEAVTSLLAGRFAESVTSVWIQPQPGGGMPEPWIPPGQPPPHLVTGAAIRQAIVVDAYITGILIQILAVTASRVACGLALDLDLAVDRDNQRVEAIKARAGDRGRIYNPVRARARDLDRARAHARERARDLARALDGVRALEAVHADAHALAVGLASPIDPDHAVDRSPVTARRQAHWNFSARAHALSNALARDLDLNQRVRLPGISAVPSAWISSGPLGRISWKAMVAMPFPAARQAFADELTSSAGIEETTQIRASLDGSLIEALRSICSAESPENHVGPGWDPAAASCLADTSPPFLKGHHPPDARDAAGIRAVALALASDSAGGDDDIAVNVLREVAATVTLLQHREQGKAKIGESIILALT
ncbi:MAG: hypothetical protein ABSA53_37995 [Streptosporangiaceae bacterium]